MGFWDTQLADLEANGIMLDPLEEQILEEGGQVLHLRHLAHPESTVDHFMLFYDQHDQPVYVIEKLVVQGPDEILEGWQYFASSPETVAASMEADWGGWWRKYPTYVGLLDNADAYAGPGYASYQEWRSESPRPYRFWTCTPLIDERVYEVISQACRERISDSRYWDLELLSSYQQDDDFWVDIGSLWLDRNDPGKLTEDEEKYLQGWYETVHPEEDDIRAILSTYEALVEEEILPPPWLTREEHVELKPIEFKPIEHYLTDPLGLEVWRMLTARHDYVYNRLMSTAPNQSQFQYQESGFTT